MYNVLQQLTNPAKTFSADIDATGPGADSAFFEALAEMKELQGDFASHEVVAYAQSVALDLAIATKDACTASLNATGIDANAASMVNAATTVLASLGLGGAVVLAGESFGSEADRINNTVLAGEALDIKARAEAVWKWIKEMIVKAKAWVLKQFDGAAKLAKSFEALEKAASEKQSAGKQLKENSAKVKVSASHQGLLSKEGGNSMATDPTEILNLYTSAQEFVYKTYFDLVKGTVTAFGNVAKASDSEAMGTATGALFTAVNKIEFEPLKLSNNQQIIRAGEGALVKESVDGTTAAKLTAAGTRLKDNSAKVKPIQAVAPKFNGDKEVAPMSLDKVQTFCNKANNAMSELAKQRDLANKGLEISRDLESAMKDAGGHSEDLVSESTQLNKIGGTLANSLTTPVTAFGSMFISAMGAAYSYAKSSTALYTK